MELTTQEIAGNAVRVVLSGRLDIAGAAAIDMRLSTLAGTGRSMVVDLAAVPFLASMGIRSLLSAAKAVAGKGGKLVVLAPQPEVEKTMRTAGLDGLIPIFATEPEARAALAA
jgi:anti-sigma B factor antagonist